MRSRADPMEWVAVVTAAGSSSRMGSGTKKEYLQIAGTSVLCGAVVPFLRTGIAERCVVTYPAGQRELVEESLADLEEPDRVGLVEGGPTRQISVLAGLRAFAESSPRFVLIHDGSRPWVGESLVRAVCEGTRLHSACVPVVPMVDAPKVVDPAGFVRSHPAKTDFVAAQTPQGFRFAEILSAHQKAEGDGRTYLDDAEVYHSYVGRVFTVPGDPSNRKITYAHDLPRGAENSPSRPRPRSL